ncbi:MAG: hypothetical protein AAF721_07620 [Myxococcota bacterium]
MQNLHRSALSRIVAALGLAALVQVAACDDDSNTDASADTMAMPSGEACEADETTVATFGTDDEGDTCAPTPAECDADMPCASDDCVAALYALCEEGTVGAGCSDGADMLIVSCNA